MARKAFNNTKEAIALRQHLHGVCIVLTSEHTNPAAVQAWREASARYHAARETLPPGEVFDHDAEWAKHQCSGTTACPYAKKVIAQFKVIH